jgi:predicted PurR-regulated permease PerM
MNQTIEQAPVGGSADELAASVTRSKEAWRRLAQHLLSITPAGVIRLLLVIGALGGLGWVLTRSFVPLLPFVFGLVLAYITAPIVHALDRVLPRGLAVLLVIVGELVSLVLIVAVLVIPLGRETTQLIRSLPGPEELNRFFDNLAAHVRTLPESSQEFIRDGLRRAATQMRDNLGAYVQRAMDLGIGTLLGLIKAFNFVIGLWILPTWLYAVVSDQQRGVRALNKLLPSGMRADFWAVVRIVDRVLAVWLRWLVLKGLMVGTVTYLALALLERGGLVMLKYKLLAAVLAGLLELIPDIGPYLWAIPASLIGFSSSTEAGLALLGTYILGRWLVQRFLVARMEERVVRGIHPAVMAVAIVALSEFGVGWLFLAAPMVVIARDLFRYVHGRVSEPPRPPGLLPDEPLGAPQQEKAIPARQAARQRSGRRRPVHEVQEPSIQDA